MIKEKPKRFKHIEEGSAYHKEHKLLGWFILESEDEDKDKDKVFWCNGWGIYEEMPFLTERIQGRFNRTDDF